MPMNPKRDSLVALLCNAKIGKVVCFLSLPFGYSNVLFGCLCVVEVVFEFLVRKVFGTATTSWFLARSVISTENSVQTQRLIVTYVKFGERIRHFWPKTVENSAQNARNIRDGDIRQQLVQYTDSDHVCT